MMTENRPNPFAHMGQWYWRDADEQTHGPFKHQREALFDLLRHAYPDFQTEQEKLRTGIVNAVLIELPFVIVIIALCYWWFGK
jgi:hypothetical protein